MLHQLLKEQNEENRSNQENAKPSRSRATKSPQPIDKDDEDFVPVSHRDAEADAMNIDSHPDDDPPASPPGARLQRMSGNLLDLDDEAEHSFLHPLMGHLQGRLLGRNMARNAPNKFAPLHPYTQILQLIDVDECVRVEAEAFPEHERCSREKFIYRLTKCPELCFGLFSKPSKSGALTSGIDEPSELIAHVICTRTPAPCVTDASMTVPPDWTSKGSTLAAPGEAEPLGHQDEGGTIALHSLAVGIKHQRKGLGTVLLKSFIQRIRESKIADQVALLAHDHLIGFYKGQGFRDMGPSDATFGEGGWRNMVLEFTDQDD